MLLLTAANVLAQEGAAPPQAPPSEPAQPVLQDVAPLAPSPAGAALQAAPTPEAAAATEAAAAAPPEPIFDFGGAAAIDDAALSIKAYGDTLFQVRDNAAVHDTFAAAHLDLFLSSDIGRLSFLSEVFFEASENEIGVDLERLQIAYLFTNWLRARAGRMHTAFGYYNDTYHHGNLFELTTERPYSVQFEDEGGLFSAHLVGVGVDGTFLTGGGTSFHYDLEVGNGRDGDVTKVAIEEAAKDDKLVNVRLRFIPFDGFTIGVNALHDVVPAYDANGVMRVRASELIFGFHVVYMVQQAHLLFESFIVRHGPNGASVTETYGGFLEAGYAFGDFTPYFRPEWIHFPKRGDVVYQAADSMYVGTNNMLDLRVGVCWQTLAQLAVKFELQRLAHDHNHQEIATVKAAFGF